MIPRFDDFYAAQFQRLSLQLYAYTGDVAQAQDVVQEAFCRALTRWDKIAHLEDPLGWVRRVAWNLATSRFRRLRVAQAHARRQREEHVEGPSPDRVMLTRALATLPDRHRRAIVLLNTDPSKSERNTINKVVDVDFDHDGALESVALIRCSVQGSDYVVVALDRAADRSIVTVGTVVWTSEDDAIRTVFDIRADSDGAVGVQVGDGGTCCGSSEDMVEHQWRSYGFDGKRFQQAGGPTKFTPKPAANDLALSGGGDLALGKPSNGARRGSLTVTVRNNGPKTAPGAIIEVYVFAEQGLPAPITIATDLNDCSRTTQTNQGVTVGCRLRCHLYPYAVGASRSYTFRFTSPVANDAAIGAGSNQFSAGVAVTEEQPGIRILEDPNNLNNEVSGKITLAP